MATLYRCNTPTDWLCPCGTVARALIRHGIDFEEIKLPQSRTKRPEVEELTDQQRVPVLLIDGQAICDSRRIREYLDFRAAPEPAAPPQPATQPPGHPDPEPEPGAKQPLWQ